MYGKYEKEIRMKAGRKLQKAQKDFDDATKVLRAAELKLVAAMSEYNWA